VERVIERLAHMMIGVAALAGALSGFALLGVSYFGPFMADSGSSASTLLFLAFVVWPALGIVAVAMEGLSQLWSTRREPPNPTILRVPEQAPDGARNPAGECNGQEDR
jgi:hypothetical protein